MPGPTVLLHLAERARWETARPLGAYTPERYAADGFVHLSAPHQAARTANLLYRGRTDLVVLAIDPAALGDALVWEPGSHGEAEDYPHLYAPLPVAAVVAVADLVPGPDGTFATIPFAADPPAR